VIGLISLTQLVVKGESISRQHEIRIHGPKTLKPKGRVCLISINLARVTGLTQDQGHIINLGSVAGREPYAGGRRDV
jgi:hypothetical protein